MKHSQRFLAIVSVLFLFASFLPVSAIAETTRDDFSYTLTNDQQGVIITGYTGDNTVVDIPDTIDGLPVVQIGSKAFASEYSLTSIILPETLQQIGNDAFKNCSDLTSITIPNSVSKIGNYAFFACSSLSEIVVSPYTYDIGSNAFHNTAWLYDQPNGAVYIGRVLYTYKGSMPENTILEVKDHTASVAAGALQNQDKLLGVKLPVGLRLIGNNAFYHCDELQFIRIAPSVTSIGNNILSESYLAKVRCAKGSEIDIYCEKNDISKEHDATLDYIDGDMNKNGAVDSTDFRILMRAIVLGNECDHERFLSSDIIYDGSVDTKDLREWMMQSIL